MERNHRICSGGRGIRPGYGQYPRQDAHPLGKARPWILWTAIPMGLGLVIVFTIPSGLGDGAKMAWATITYILMAVVIYTA